MLDDRINAAELVILPFTEAPGEQLSSRLRMQLLARAGVEAVILRGGGQHELFLVGAEPPPVQADYNAGETGLIEQIRDVIRCLFAIPGRTIRIDATMSPDRSIVVIANEEPIRLALFTFSTRVLVAFDLCFRADLAARVYQSLSDPRSANAADDRGHDRIPQQS